MGNNERQKEFELGLEQYRKSVKESKRASILTAGRENFLKNGYNRAAVADIARQADVSTATLYKHFASKEDLFATVVHDACADIGDEFMPIADGDDLRQIFHDLAWTYLKAQFEFGVVALLRIVIAEVPHAPQVAIDTYQFITLHRKNQLIKTLDHLVERKLLKPHDTDLGITLIAGMVKEIFVWPALFDANYKLPENADEIVYEAIDTYLAHYAA